MPTSASRSSPQKRVVAVTALSESSAAVVDSLSSRPGAWSSRTPAPIRSAMWRAISLLLRCGLLESQPPTSGTTTTRGWEPGSTDPAGIDPEGKEPAGKDPAGRDPAGKAFTSDSTV